MSCTALLYESACERRCQVTFCIDADEAHQLAAEQLVDEAMCELPQWLRDELNTNGGADLEPRLRKACRESLDDKAIAERESELPEAI